MVLSHIAALAIVQGLTEFLPVSSSAHLVLFPTLFGWPDQGLTFDVATHFGTLIAVVAYFAKDLREMTVGVFSADEEGWNEHRRLALHLVVGTVPVVFAGALLVDLVGSTWRSPLVIAAATVGFGVVMAFADWRWGRTEPHVGLNLRRAVTIGLAQVLALIPGTSRSGITITAGLMLGLSRTESARFSFLLSIPVILAAASFGLVEVVRGAALIDWQEFLLATIFSAIAGWICLGLFLRFVERMGLIPFAIYRVLLGAALWLTFAP